jgi:hypothetical protein
MMSPSKRTQGLLFTTLLFVAGVLLLFCRLDDIYLWQDEAETALIARHLHVYGLPLSTDGRDWVQQYPQVFREFNRDYIWTYHPWLQYLLTAVSFAVLGTTTFAARFPFALAGLATVLALYHFVLRWLQDSLSARVAGVLLLLCVPFLVLMRQCRYYALSALFTLLIVDSYLWLRSDRPWAVPYFVLSAVLLFHSFYVAFIPTLAALAVHMLLARAAPVAERRLLLALLLIALLTLPWIRLIPVWRASLGAFVSTEQPAQPPAPSETAAAQPSPSLWASYLGGLAWSFLYITLWVFPLLLGLAWLIAWLLSRRRPSRPRVAPSSLATNRGAPGLAAGTEPWMRRSKAGGSVHHPDETAFYQIVGAVIAANIAALSILDYPFFRYLTHLMPLLLALLGVAVAWFIERWPMAGYALLLVLVTSNGLHILPYKLLNAAVPQQSRLWSELMDSAGPLWIDQVRSTRLRSELWMYGQELTHSYQGPNEGLVAYLSVHAMPGQTALVNYEDLPLQFYTDLRVLGGFSAHGLTPDLRPDWVIDRKYGPYRDLLADILAAGSYERITIPFPDIKWENREEARQHHYLTVENEDPVILYRLQGH